MKAGFKIYKDSINDSSSITGKTYLDYQGGKARLRLLDGDNIPYFYLYSDFNYETELLWNPETKQFEKPHSSVFWSKYSLSEEDFEFYMLDSLGNSYGCVSLEYWSDEEEKWIEL